MHKLHAFVRDRHPDAVLLEKVAVSSAVVERLQAVADGAVAEASWFEVRAGANNGASRLLLRRRSVSDFYPAHIMHDVREGVAICLM